MRTSCRRSLPTRSRFGTTASGEPDLALLVDGLEAEREQGITIDVAYRYFSTARRSFIVADAPGHEQYTRNMATAASTADACRAAGGCAQRLAHANAPAQLHRVADGHPPRRAGGQQNGCRQLGSADVFDDIAFAYRKLPRKSASPKSTCIPISALRGDNVVSPSAMMPWYVGPTLLGHLEAVEISSDLAAKPFRMPVQWVNRPEPGLPRL